MNDDELSFEQQAWLVINAIPYGRVASYGDIARLAGHPNAARQIGRILSKLPEQSKLPWHRVIGQQGTLSLSGERLLCQQEALRSEGVIINERGRVCMKKYRWQP